MYQDIATTQYDLGEIIAIGWKTFWKNFRDILTIFLIVYVPINIGLSFVPIGSLIEEYGMQGFKMYLKIAQLVEFLIGVLATMSLACLIESRVLGKPITWKESFGEAFSRWGASVWTGLLAVLIIAGMTLLFLVPGIIWSLYYYFIIYVVALRCLSGKEALDYSRKLVKGQWWRVFGYVFVIGLLSVVATLVVVAPFFFTPEILVLDLFSDTLCDLIFALFMCMTIVFFLNTDYLKQASEEDGYEFPSAPITNSHDIRQAEKSQEITDEKGF